MNANDPIKKTRAEILIEKLTNFFTWLSFKPYVNKEPKAAEAVTTTAKLVLMRKQDGSLANYQKFKAYVDDWILPAFERVPYKSTWKMKLKDGMIPEEKQKTMPEKKPYPWYDWLMYQNIGYWEIDHTVIPEPDMKKMYQYLECFVVLTCPFDDLQHKKEEDMKKKLDEDESSEEPTPKKIKKEKN